MKALTLSYRRKLHNKMKFLQQQTLLTLNLDVICDIIYVALLLS